MTTLITGAAGFIGSHLVRALQQDGHAVVGLDDLSTGHAHNLPDAAEGWRFVCGDIRDPETCAAAMRGVTQVVHLAARNSVPRSLADPRSALEVNVMGSFNLLEAAHAAGVHRFVFASSSSVYGDDPRLPKAETHPSRPLSPYAASKASVEHLARAWSASRGLPTLGLRFFNVFGPHQDPAGAYAAVVPRFIQAALHGSRPIIHGDGSFTRDFTYVENVVHALRLALGAPEATAGETVNIACGGRVSVLQLWRAIAAETGFEGEPRFGPARPGDMPHSQADLSAAEQLLGYRPVIPFEEGICRTVSWHRSRQMGVAA